MTVTCAALLDSFEHDRSRLLGIARRVLGSSTDAADAVQEVWIKVSSLDPGYIDNPSALFTTVTTRTCIDMIRTRSRRREVSLDTVRMSAETISAEGSYLARYAAATSLVVLLDEASPVQRAAYFLHDIFGVPYADVGSILGASGEAVKKMASRARRRVRAARDCSGAVNPAHMRVAERFLDAVEEGDMRSVIDLVAPGTMVEMSLEPAGPRLVSLQRPGGGDVIALTTEKQGPDRVACGRAWAPDSTTARTAR